MAGSKCPGERTANRFNGFELDERARWDHCHRRRLDHAIHLHRPPVRLRTQPKPLLNSWCSLRGDPPSPCLVPLFCTCLHIDIHNATRSPPHHPHHYGCWFLLRIPPRIQLVQVEEQLLRSDVYFGRVVCGRILIWGIGKRVWYMLLWLVR